MYTKHLVFAIYIHTCGYSYFFLHTKFTTLPVNARAIDFLQSQLVRAWKNTNTSWLYSSVTHPSCNWGVQQHGCLLEVKHTRWSLPNASNSTVYLKKKNCFAQILYKCVINANCKLYTALHFWQPVIVISIQWIKCYKEMVVSKLNISKMHYRSNFWHW